MGEVLWYFFKSSHPWKNNRNWLVVSSRNREIYFFWKKHPGWGENDLRHQHPKGLFHGNLRVPLQCKLLGLKKYGRGLVDSASWSLRIPKNKALFLGTIALAKVAFPMQLPHLLSAKPSALFYTSLSWFWWCRAVRPTYLDSGWIMRWKKTHKWTNTGGNLDWWNTILTSTCS